MIRIPIFLLLVCFSAPAASQHAGDAYESGLNELNQGNWVQALDIWLHAKNNSSDQWADPRIGFEFIKTVTKHQAKQYYNIANQMFFWGLSAHKIQPYEEEIFDELQRIKSLTDRSQSNYWLSLLENNDPALYIELKTFWINNDPISSSPYNERLIEHWERIHRAQKNFTKNTNSVYATDDRGLIYVKYGEPDDIQKGTLSLNNTDIQLWAKEILTRQEPSDAFTSTGMSFEQRALSILSTEVLEDNLAKQIVDRVLTHHNHSDYEIWIYKRMNTGYRNNLIFIFGYPAGGRPYGLVDSPEEFISNSAFRPRSMRRENYSFNMGPLFQLSIYNDLKFVDDYFLDSFHDLQDNLYNNQSIIDESSSEYLRNKYSSELRSIQDNAPLQASIYDLELADIEITTDRYRFLDQDNKPYDMVMVYSKPHNVIIADYHRFSQSHHGEEPNYHLKHTLTMRDGEMNIHNRVNDFPVISFEPSLVSRQFEFPSSIFRVASNIPEKNKIIEAEMYNLSYAGLASDLGNYQVPKEIIGYSKTEIKLSGEGETLNETDFEVSDLVVGYNSDSGLDEEDHFFPFFIPNETVIPVGYDLNLLLEVYNLTRNEQNQSHFTIHYQVTGQRDRSWLRSLFSGSDDKTSLTLNYETIDSRSKEHLIVDISDYEPGKYTIELTITDTVAGKSIARSKSFQVKEPIEPTEGRQ